MKILTIVGARPQIIKASALSKEIDKYANIEEIILHTGQHYDIEMSGNFFTELQIPLPKYNLNINQLSHGAMTGRMIEEIEKIIIHEKPNYVVVYGDTNSTLAGAIATKKTYSKLVHIEAGLRSNDMQMPEEINRIITDRISDILFCPTEKAMQNLKNEGFEHFNCTYIKTGDIMLDVAKYYMESNSSNILQELGITKNYIVSTIHRESNINNIENLKNIVDALNKINEKVQVVCPLHPKTKQVMEQQNIIPHFKIIEPVGYIDMMQLIKHSELVITDSGGLQKEAYFFKKPSIILRETTEWVELVENKYSILVGCNTDKILKAFETFNNNKPNFQLQLYGDAYASKGILAAIFEDNNKNS